MVEKLGAGRYFGHQQGSREIAGLSLTETRYAPGTRLPEHSHEQAYFCLVLGGTFTEWVAGRARACRPSTLLYHPPRELHSDDFHEHEGLCFNLELGPQWLARTRERLPIFLEPALFDGGPLPNLCSQIYSELHRLDSASVLAIEGLTLEVLAQMSRRGLDRPARPVPGWLTEVRALLQDRFSEPLTLATLAHQVGVNPTHVARAFRQHFGCTVGGFVRRLRIEFARSRVVASEDPLVEVAVAAGFFDQSHFTRTYKRLTGMSPAAHRAACRARKSGASARPSYKNSPEPRG
jgi:AraC family transcriptional regulator